MEPPAGTGPAPPGREPSLAQSNVVDQAGDPAASSSPTRPSPFELLARAWSWFRATLRALSTQCFHQVSLPVDLVRMPVIETGPDEWRSSARPSSYTGKSGENVTGGGGKWTESNLLPKKDCVYSAATAPAYPYLHFPNCTS